MTFVSSSVGCLITTSAAHPLPLASPRRLPTALDLRLLHVPYRLFVRPVVAIAMPPAVEMRVHAVFLSLPWICTLTAWPNPTTFSRSAMASALVRRTSQSHQIPNRYNSELPCLQLNIMLEFEPAYTKEMKYLFSTYFTE